ncbi:MAG: transporter substrate-binding domain-containing protein, partial [Rubrivivax sp.]
ARGFSTELLKLMAAEAGLPLRVQVLPWQRSVQEAARRADSVLFSLTRTPERETQYRWVGPISPRRILVYRLNHRTDVRPQSLKELKGLRVGVTRDSAAGRQLIADGLRPEVELELATDDATNLRKLLAGRMDLIVMLDWAAAWHLRELKLPYATLTPVLPMDVDKSYWYGLPADSDPALARRLQAALDRIRRDGRYERLRQHYFD